jgi:hypothetical protein
MTDHILLCVAASLSQFLNPHTQSAEKLSLIDHVAYLEEVRKDDHEQISCEFLGGVVVVLAARLKVEWVAEVPE